MTRFVGARATYEVTDKQIRALKASPGDHETYEVTDKQIRALKASPGDHETFVTCLIALGDKRSPGRGGKHAARARCAEIINARERDRCLARQHPRHVSDVCKGACCTTCGGPIDDNGECRC
jgi:hypothetical protein